MTGAADWLFRVGLSALQTGLMLWLGLILYLAFSTGGWKRLIGWSIPGQFAELGHLIRQAGQGGWPRTLSRLASALAAAGVTALILSGLLALVRLFSSGPAA